METVVVVSGGIAEAVQAVPVVQALTTHFGRPVLMAVPPAAIDVSRLLCGEATILPVPALAAGAPAHLRAWSTLRSRRLDLAVLCSELTSVRAAVYLAGVPRRVGCRRGGLGDLLLTDGVRCEAGDNRGQAWLRLAALLGAPAGRTTAPRAVLDTALGGEQRLLATGVGDGRLLVAIAPGSGFREIEGETWRPERWAHLANQLGSRHGAGVVIVGDESDREVAATMRMDLAALSVDLCGELTLTATAAVIARCDLLLSGDTPLLQVAAAVGTPSIGLFAATDGRVRGSAGREHRIVQALPQGATASLDGLRVDDVLAAIESPL